MTYNQRLDLIKEYEEYKVKLKGLIRMINSDMHMLKNGTEERKAKVKRQLNAFELSQIVNDIHVIRKKYRE